MASEEPQEPVPDSQKQPATQSVQFLDNLASLSDDDFFNRLSALRAEHKRTLMHYEKLYHEKLLAEHGGDIGMIFGEPLFSTKPNDDDEKDNAPSSLYVSGVGVTLSARASSPKEEDPDKAPELSPIPQRSQEPVQDSVNLGRDYNLSLQEPVNTGGDTFNQSLEVVRRSAEKPPRSPCPVHKCKEAWTENDDPRTLLRTRHDSSGDEVDYSKYDETRYQKERNEALDRIEAMWDNFSIDDYKEISKPKSTENGWRNRITMPEPFRMTLREENKPKTKSRTLLEYEHKKAMDEMTERFECEKKFRAAPVPAHVYLPLYEELNEQAESRRRANVDVAKKLLMSQESPFKFNERTKKIPDHSRRHSAPIVKNKQFKAKPIPKSVYADVSERLLEEEEYRKIRIKMRSKELLRTASLPPRMASNEQYTVGRLKEKLKQAKKEPEKKFKPRIKKKVPDFDTIHRKQQKEAMNRYRNREAKIATVCEPFNLRTSSIPSNIDKIIDDIHRDEEQLNENRWPYKSLRAKPKLGEVRRSYDALPAQTTTADQLRASRNYEEMRKKSSKEVQNEKNRERQLQLARQRRKQIAEKAAANDQSKDLKASNAEKLRQYKEEQRQRMEEYRRELAEIEARVSKQPFLFERQSQINARKQAEKRFVDALREAGVDENSLSSLTRPSSLPHGPRSPDQVANLTDDDEPGDDLPDDNPANRTYDATTRDYDDDDDAAADYQYTQSFDDDDDEIASERSGDLVAS